MKSKVFKHVDLEAKDEQEGKADDQVRRFGFLIVPQFPLLAFSSALEPLRAANRLRGEQLYEWLILTPDNQPVRASNDIEVVPDVNIGEEPHLDVVFVCSGLDYTMSEEKSALAWLRGLERKGTSIGAISSGAFNLAEAGLMEGFKCTIHYEIAPAFRERFPDISLTENIFEIDRNRYTCSGGTSALDLVLNLIAKDRGAGLALEISQQFQHDRVRDGLDRQKMTLKRIFASKSQLLLAATDTMERNIETPLPTSELAKVIGVSTRQLERIFERHVGMPPNRYYAGLRLERARLLLLQTTLPVADIAAMTGFSSPSHLTKRYRERFSRSPTQERGSTD
ncbi:MAG: GlxA family transcriptional regulator [Rhizobiales bacterium]|nr:GlxA family transcriptional regulator [Hyphomicrobiales bacterium]